MCVTFQITAFKDPSELHNEMRLRRDVSMPASEASLSISKSKADLHNNNNNNPIPLPMSSTTATPEALEIHPTGPTIHVYSGKPHVSVFGVGKGIDNGNGM